MRTPSPPYCRLDLAPPLADRFIFEVALIDYGPVLLLMPFGFHLAMDTLPSGNRKWWLQVRLGCIQLSPSCPFRPLHTFLSPGPRGITPAFGYGAPHSSARGTSTLLNNALLSAHYATVRLPAAVHLGLIAHRLLPAVRCLLASDSDGVSRFSRVKFLCMHGVFDSAGPAVDFAFTAHCRIAFRTA
jgi:hypothetical protein